MPTPYRTGLPSLRLLLHKVCQLITKYRDVVSGILTEDQMVYYDAVFTACKNFMDNVPNPRP